MRTNKHNRPTHRSNIVPQFLGLIVILAVSVSGTHAQRQRSVAPATLPHHAASAVLDFGMRYPDELVSVIVQQVHVGGSAQALISQLQGQVTNDLQIINAVAARVPGRALAVLAASPEVKWVSLDSPIAKSSADDGVVTLREDFDSIIYQDQPMLGQWSNSATWPGQTWAEMGESDGPNEGDVLIAPFLGGQYIGLRMRGAGKGLQSSINLSDALNAHLSFSYRRKNFDAESDDATLEVSHDDGATWSAIGHITGPADDQQIQSADYDLTPFVGQNIQIRFVLGSSISALSHFYVDALRVTYTPQVENNPTPVSQPFQYFLPMVAHPDGVAQPAAQAEEATLQPTQANQPRTPSAINRVYDVRDRFNAGSFCNEDGNENWGNCWVESEPVGGGTGIAVGHVRVANNKLTLEDAPDSGGQPSVSRQVNLSNAASAYVEFDFQTSAGVDASDAIVFEVSTDNGATYSTLTTITGITGAVNRHQLIDLTRFVGSTVTLRFRVAFDYGSSNETFSLSYIGVMFDQIQATANWGTPIPKQSTWKYLADGTNQGGAWRQPGFNDSTWTSGLAEFGYGFGYEQTVVSYGSSAGNKYLTTYFRRTFNVSDASQISSLNTNLLVDDGAVVYLNGTEIKRYNMPTGTISYNTLASSAIGTSVSWQTYALPISALVNGENVIAVEVHQASANSADLLFDMELSGYYACGDCINTGSVAPFIKSIKADQTWNSAARVQGQGVTIAVVDSGIAPNADLLNSVQSDTVITQVNFISGTVSVDDLNGHGSHVAGIIGGNGGRSRGAYMGVAPKAKIIDVKVLNDYGLGSTSSVVAGLQWIYNNRDVYNIKVVNLSLNNIVLESYNTSPLDAALEILWFNKIVVVVAAGNTGSSLLFPPSNDPFVITVGSADDQGTATITDDTVSTFSAYGTTSDGFAKPDLVAPGRNIVSLLASDDSNLVLFHPTSVVTTTTGARYFKMSGTSMASAVVAGAAALLLQDEPNLNPDQVKYRLKATANTAWAGYTATKAGAGYLDIYAAVNSTSTQTANTGISASQSLFSGSTPPVWGSVNWSSVNWSSVNWSSVNWSSVNWSSVNWSSVNWGQ